MSIESLLETDKLTPATLAGVLCTAVIGAGTIETNAVTAAMVNGAVLLFVADDGSWQWHVQNGAPAGIGPYTITIHDTVRKTASGGAGNVMAVVQMNSPFFQPTTTFSRTRTHTVPGASSVNEHLLKAPAGVYRINSNEGVILKSIYVRLPYQFTFADTQVPIQLTYRLSGAVGAGNQVLQFGESGVIYVPVENIEIPLSVYIPPVGATGQRWELLVELRNADALPPINTKYAPAIEQNYSHVSTLDMNTTIAFEFLPITIGVRLIHAATALT